MGDKIKQEQKLYYQKPSGEAGEQTSFKRGHQACVKNCHVNLIGIFSMVFGAGLLGWFNMVKIGGNVTRLRRLTVGMISQTSSTM